MQFGKILILLRWKVREMEREENILGTEKISRLLLKFGVPGAISLVVNSLYNIVDQIFIGQGVGYLGNAATNLIYPLSVFAIAAGALMGDGAAAYMSLKLGQKENRKAANGAAFGLLGSVAVGILIAVLYLIFMEPLCWALGGTEANFSYALSYGKIIAIGVPFLAVSVAYGSIIRADGNPRLGMIGLLVGCVLNVILDPVFIFVCKWGMAGAALATIIGQIANAIIFLVYVFRGMKSVKIDRSVIKECPGMAKNVLSLGASSFILQVAIVAAIVIQNKMVVKYGGESKYGEDIPLAAMGVTMKVFSIVTAFINGLSTGAQPIYGFNYGAGKYERVKATFKSVLVASTIMLCVAFVIFQAFPMGVVSIFGSSDELYNEFAMRCLKIFLAGLPISGLQLIAGTFFQAMGYPVQSSLVSLSRQIIFMIPLLFVLTSIFGVDGCLYMGPIADVLSLIFTAILMKIYWKKIFMHPAKK
jgi:putative MATE family efflux protein